MLGLCLVAVFAVAAVAATSASALPEWGKCDAKAGGKYTERQLHGKSQKGCRRVRMEEGRDAEERTTSQATTSAAAAS